MEKTALVIIDMQQIMFSEEEQPYRGYEVLSNIRRLLDCAREIGMPVVFIQHADDREMPHGSEAWQICAELAPIAGEARVEKRTWDGFHKTDMDDVLRKLGAQTLILCGMQSEFCVDTTCRRAFSMGYTSYLCRDGHSTFNSRILSGEQIVAHENLVMGGRFVQLKTTSELLEMMRR